MIPSAISTFCKLVEARQMRDALDLFPEIAGNVSRIPVNHRITSRVVDCATRLLDREPSLLSQIQRLFARLARPGVFTKVNRQDSARLDLAEGALAFYEGQLDRALSLFDLARQNADRIKDEELMLTSRYYLTKAHYKSDRYQEALRIARSAGQIAPTTKFVRTAGLIAMSEAWIVFVSGDLAEAKRILRNAESALWGSDFIENANILSFKARIARRTGNFDESADLEQEAIDQFPPHLNHPNLSRCYAQKAFSHLLQAQALLRERGSQSSVEVGRFQQQAYECLAAAQPSDYRHHEASHRAMGRVHYVLGIYHFDLGQTGKAVAEFDKALFVARKFSDRALEINTLIFQSKCNNTSSVEQAKQVLHLADETDNRRLKARARINLGLAFVRDRFRNLTAARKLLDEARCLLADSDQDYLRTELNDLERALRVASAEDDQLFEVTRTLVHDRNLDDIVKMVEDSVVGAVWSSHGQNTAATAKALGTTRRRVRCILNRHRQPTKPNRQVNQS
jgi:tetratricopeptide (TPR) repeat protein